MASHLPNCNMAIMGVTANENTEKTQALYMTFLIQGKMTKALVDSGSSISLISWSFLNTLGFSGKMENYNGKILTANKTQLTVKGKAELIVQLEKFSPEFRVGFLISSVDIYDCLLGLDFLIELDCILYIKRKHLFCGKINKTLELKSSMQNTGTMFLVVSSTQIIPSRSEKLLQCEVRDEQGTRVKSFQGLVNPIESYQEATGLWVAQTLVKDSEGHCWVRLLNIHDEDIVTYKNSRVGNLEETELEQQVFSHQAKESTGTFTESFNFEKHVNINSVHLTRDQLDVVKRLCQKYEKKFFRKTRMI